jgi:hypothetical protein
MESLGALLFWFWTLASTLGLAPKMSMDLTAPDFHPFPVKTTARSESDICLAEQRFSFFSAGSTGILSYIPISPGSGCLCVTGSGRVRLTVLYIILTRLSRRVCVS